MSFTDAVAGFYRKSMTIEGRASRSEFWWFLAYLLALLFFSPVFIVLVGGDTSFILLYFILALTSIPPYLCVTVRRWHDLGKSGWYVLLLLIPWFGFFVTLIYFCMDSVKIDNMDGNRPVVFDPARSTTYKQETIPPVAPVPPVAPIQQTVYQNIIQGDHITKTEVKDSVLNRSNLGGSSKMEKLKELTEMKKEGLISGDEYEKMKLDIIG